MNEQQAWTALAQYIADSGLPYTTTLTKYPDDDEYEVIIEATFSEDFGFDVLSEANGIGSTVLEALLDLLAFLEEPETKALLNDRKAYYVATLTDALAKIQS